MRVLVVVVAVLVIVAGATKWVLSRAADASMRGLFQMASSVARSTTLKEEHLDTWSPIVLGHDTIGKLVAVTHIEYGEAPRGSILMYRGLLSRPPTYPADSLAAIDSSDNARFAHELRLIPLRATTPGWRQLGTLHFENTNVGIPVMAHP